MRDLCSYARIYQIFTDRAFNPAQPNASGRELATLRNRFNTIIDLKFGVSYPFILQLANDFEQGSLDFENFNAMLEILISYYVRRMVCGVETNALNKVTYTLYKHLNEQDRISKSGLAQFLGQKGGREIFPDDERLKRAFAEEGSDAYALRACKLILLEIEKQMNAEPPREETLQIEHFYPQNPTEKWRNLVGEEYEKLENLYRDTFGNLSLTGQNQALGNKPFDEKIELLLENGSLKLNEYFTNMTSWGIKEIKERSLYLAEKFCEVPLFRDLPKEYRTKSVFKTLNEDLTFYDFGFIRFPNGVEQKVHNAKTLAKAVIDYMYQHHREVVEDALSEVPRYITFNEDEAKRRDMPCSLSVECEKGRFYFVSSASMRDTGKNLAKFVESVGLNPQDFTIG